MNDGMGAFVAEAAVKQMILAGKSVKNARVVILGLTFKENCPDTRNSKVDDIIKKLGYTRNLSLNITRSTIPKFGPLHLRLTGR